MTFQVAVAAPLVALFVACKPDSRTCSEAPRADAEAAVGSYDVVHGWPELSAGMVLGQVSGVAIDSRGDVFVFHRPGHPWFGDAITDTIQSPAILRLERRTGTILSALGGDGLFTMPHGLRIDSHDRLWVTDVGTHTVRKLSADGAVLLQVGTPGEAGQDATHFNQPTDVYPAEDGSFYVADGYGNARIAKFSEVGEFLFEWGTRGEAPGQFDTPHSIAGDAHGRIYVADRGNGRLQVFDAEGRFLDAWKSQALGRPWAVAVAPDESIYVVDGGDQVPEPPDRAAVIHLDRSGRVLERFASFGNRDGQLYWGHAIAVDRSGDVFVGDVYYGMRVQRFARR
jgi:peptidylamidoglycolate lyase